MFGTAKYTTDMSIDTSSRASMSTPSAVHSFRPALRVTSGMFDASRDWIEPFYCVRRTRHCVDHTQNQGEGQSGRERCMVDGVATSADGPSGETRGGRSRAVLYGNSWLSLPLADPPPSVTQGLIRNNSGAASWPNGGVFTAQAELEKRSARNAFPMA